MSLQQDTAIAIIRAIKTSAESGLATSEGLQHLAEAYAKVVGFIEEPVS